MRLELRETLFGLSLSVFACSNSVVVNGREERRIFNSVFCRLEGKKAVNDSYIPYFRFVHVQYVLLDCI